jgi:hypothetical protein
MQMSGIPYAACFMGQGGAFDYMVNFVRDGEAVVAMNVRAWALESLTLSNALLAASLTNSIRFVAAVTLLLLLTDPRLRHKPHGSLAEAELVRCSLLRVHISCHSGATRVVI